MNDSSDAPTTTGRRTWRLVRTLALPWLVCGMLLWALVRLTQEPLPEGLFSPFESPDGLSVGWHTGLEGPHPIALGAYWNLRSYLAGDSGMFFGDETEVRWHSEALGIVAHYGTIGGTPFALSSVSLWWLLPFPLLWSGFNLWRWTRRAN